MIRCNGKSFCFPAKGDGLKGSDTFLYFGAPGFVHLLLAVSYWLLAGANSQWPKANGQKYRILDMLSHILFCSVKTLLKSNAPKVSYLKCIAPIKFLFDIFEQYQLITSNLGRTRFASAPPPYPTSHSLVLIVLWKLSS